MKDSSIPTILAVAILLVGITDGVIFIRNKQIFNIYALNETSPKNVRVTNIKDSSFTISWTTDRKTSGFIRWGKTEPFLNRVSLSPSEKSSHTHFVNVEGLSPRTAYFFKINSGGKEFDNNGINWKVQTGELISTQSQAYIISGKIITSLGEPVEGALVYTVIGGSSPLSTLTTKEGGWTINIGQARTLSLANYISFDEEKTPIEILVQGGPNGIASAYMYPVSAKPAPPIVIGKTHNFKNTPSEEINYVPEARIDFP